MGYIKKISEEKRNELKMRSAYGLPDRPSEAGMTAEQIKSVFSDPIVGEGAFVDEVNRVIDETEEALAKVQKIEKDYITPEMYGAIGDGETDDTDAVAKALSNGAKVLLQGTYAIRGGITSTASHIVGENAKLIMIEDTITVIKCTGLSELSGVMLDCKDKSVYYGFYISESNPMIKNVSVCNIRNIKKDANCGVFGTYIKGGKVVIDGYEASNLYAVGNGAVADSLGSANGLVVSGYEDLVAKNLTFEEIHTFDANANIIFEDASGIYIANGSNEGANAVISCVKGKNFGKRLIKAQAYHVSVDNVFAQNQYGDNLSFIGILPPGGDVSKRVSAVVSNCTLIDTCTDSTVTDSEGTYARRIMAIYGDVIVNNCKFVAANCFCASLEEDANASFNNCEFGVYGILHHGNDLNVLDCTFKSKIGIHSNVTPTGKATIKNSKMNWLSGDKSFSGYPYNALRGTYFIENSIIEAGSMVSPIVIYGFSRLSNVTFTVESVEGRTQVDTIVKVESTADVVMNNIYIDATKALSLSTKPIKYFANYGKLLMDGIEARDTDTSVRFVYNYSTGDLTVKNTQINRVDSTNGSLSVPQPPYVDALPSKYRYPEGVSVRLKTDDKLYTKTDGEWVAVG